MNKYTRECPLCGVQFETTRSNRKYCDACKGDNNALRKIKRLESRLSHEGLQDYISKVVNYTCDYCGRDHAVARRHLSKISLRAGAAKNWNDEDHLYCCIEHKEADIHDHYKCDWCGRLLKDCDYPFGPMRQFNYCSDECKVNHEWKLAEKAGNVFTCYTCNKKFIRRGNETTFCSRQCKKEAINAGWTDPQKAKEAAAKKASQVTKQYICAQCKKPYTKTHANIVMARIYDGMWHFCNSKCEDDYFHEIENRKHPRSDSSNLEVMIGSSDKHESEPLCTTCKTSYKNCERMQSGFRIIPEGAHYNGSGVLVTCPKYRR